jgi:hydroxymethylpyrimidine pyrophosphatase-like HAD family hydrolase
VSGWFRALALDYDGTIADTDVPGEEVLAAIAEARRAGRRAILVTGRILVELREVFPQADACFDAIVAENGCVLASGGATRVLSAPVEFELDEALVAQGVPFRRGQVLLATRALYEAEVMEALRRLGLECQVTRNRGELMILPPGMSKGFGVFQALGDLGVSHHSTVAFGDAENDHSLLRGCELGVAVAGAVASLRRSADVVLDEPGSAGVAGFLRGPVISGEASVEPRRWRLDLGVFPDGSRARIPASQVNVLITGRSNSGKSYLAGMLAEQLVGLGYSICVVDPEGDYASLGRLRGTLHLGGAGTLPRPDQIGRFVEHRFGSVLLDLSLSDRASGEKYVPALLGELEAERRATGLPHWILLDEAHHLRAPAAAEADADATGYCLVTYRPHELPEALRRSIDVVLVLPGGKHPDPGAPDPLETLAALYGLELDAAAPGCALLARPRQSRLLRPFTLGPRDTPHVRHWHKYLAGSLAPSLHFQFRGDTGEVRHVARNVGDLHRVLELCTPDVVRFHAARRDVSRWLRAAIQDESLADAADQLERRFAESSQRDADVAVLRRRLLLAIELRYVDGVR